MTPAIRFGLSTVTCQRYPGDERPDVDIYEEVLALAEEAEQLGFDSIWCGEHHFLDDAYLPSVLVLCAALAARTQRMTVGTSVLLAPLHNTLRLAEDAAVVDLLARGRFVLGIGMGWRPEEFEAFGIPLRGRHRYFEAQVHTLRQAWSDGLVTGGGQLLRYNDLSVTPKPFRAGGPPVFIGGQSEAAVRRAGRIGDGLLVVGMAAAGHFSQGWSLTPETLAEQVGWVQEELARAGRDPDEFSFCISLPTLVFDDEAIWEGARAHLWYAAWKYSQMGTARSGRASLPPPVPAEADAEFRRESMVGPPDLIVDRLGAFAEAAGGRIQFHARVFWPGLDAEVMRQSMTRLAREVMPHFT